MTQERFGQRLKELREASGLTQAELAAKAGLNRVSLAQLETGRREPALSTLRALLAALNVSCELLLAPPAIEHETRRGRPPRPDGASASEAGEAAQEAAVEPLRRRRSRKDAGGQGEVGKASSEAPAKKRRKKDG